MRHIEKVRVYHSKVNCLNDDENDDLGPGFAVIIEPVPTTELEDYKRGESNAMCNL